MIAACASCTVSRTAKSWRWCSGRMGGRRTAADPARGRIGRKLPGRVASLADQPHFGAALRMIAACASCTVSRTAKSWRWCSGRMGGRRTAADPAHGRVGCKLPAWVAGIADQPHFGAALRMIAARPGSHGIAHPRNHADGALAEWAGGGRAADPAHGRIGRKLTLPALRCGASHQPHFGVALRMIAALRPESHGIAHSRNRHSHRARTAARRSRGDGALAEWAGGGRAADPARGRVDRKPPACLASLADQPHFGAALRMIAARARVAGYHRTLCS